MISQEIRCKDRPTCPYCLHEEKDAWEFDWGGCEGSTTITCGRCERDYFVERWITTHYNSMGIR